MHVSQDFTKRAGLLSLITAASLMVWATCSAATPLPGSFHDLVEKVAPAVVTITTEKVIDTNGDDTPDLPFDVPPGSPLEKFFHDFQKHQGAQGPAQKQKQSALGSGFIIDSAGYVVTNNHVVEGGQNIKVDLADGDSYDAKVVGTDPKTDLALLKINVGSKTLPTVEWGDSDTAKVGDWVIAVGNPFGLTSTVTTGIVSARGRDINSGPFDDFLQIDASVNRGNSGGPTFDVNGKVVGINTAIYSPNGGSVGIAFAIPSNTAQKVIAELKASGAIARGWLGVAIQKVTPDLANAMGLGKPRGALVSEITEKGPAAGLGLMPGDVIVTFDGEEVKDVHDLPRIVAAHKPGSTVSFVVWRDGKDITLSVKLGTLPSGATQLADASSDGPSGGAGVDKKEPVVLGMHLARIDPVTRKQYSLPNDLKGALITEVDPNSPSGDIELRPGDVIRQVGHQDASTPKAVASAVADAKKSGRSAVLLLVTRGGADLFVALKFPPA